MTDLRWRRVAPVAVLAALAGLGLVASPAVAAPDNDPDVSLAAPSNIICWETPDPEDPCDVTIVLSIAVNVPVIEYR